MTATSPLPVPVNASTHTTYTQNSILHLMTTSGGTSSSSATMVSNTWGTATITTTIPSASLASLLHDGNIVNLVRSFLETKGLSLGDRGVLKLKDDKPLVEYVHRDGKDVHGYHRGVIDLKPGIHDLLPGTVFRTSDGTCYQVNQDGTLERDVLTNVHDKVIDVSGGDLPLYESLAYCHFSDIHIPDGSKKQARFTLPDGTVLTINPDGSTTIDDSNSKRLYHTKPTYAFNPYLNASDLLEEFIGYCAEQKITKEGFKELPISLFIYWLIVRAAEADGDPLFETQPLLEDQVARIRKPSHRCRCCGKFIPKKYENMGVNFCSPNHMATYLGKI